MTAADGSRLTQLDHDLWVDLDEVVGVRTYVDQLLTRNVEVTLRNGATYAVRTCPQPGSGNPMTEEERDHCLDLFLLHRLGGLLEHVDHTTYPRDRSTS